MDESEADGREERTTGIECETSTIDCTYRSASSLAPLQFILPLFTQCSVKREMDWNRHVLIAVQVRHETREKSGYVLVGLWQPLSGRE